MVQENEKTLELIRVGISFFDFTRCTSNCIASLRSIFFPEKGKFETTIDDGCGGDLTRQP